MNAEGVEDFIWQMMCFFVKMLLSHHLRVGVWESGWPQELTKSFLNENSEVIVNLLPSTVHVDLWFCQLERRPVANVESNSDKLVSNLGRNYLLDRSGCSVGGQP